MVIDNINAKDLEKTVIALCKESLKKRVRITRLPDTKHKIVPLLIMADHFFYLLRRILEICIYGHYCITLCMIQTCRERSLKPKVSS